MDIGSPPNSFLGKRAKDNCLRQFPAIGPPDCMSMYPVIDRRVSVSLPLSASQYPTKFLTHHPWCVKFIDAIRGKTNIWTCSLHSILQTTQQFPEWYFFHLLPLFLCLRTYRLRYFLSGFSWRSDSSALYCFKPFIYVLLLIQSHNSFLFGNMNTKYFAR